MEWDPGLVGVGFFCFVFPRAWKQKKLTPLDRGPPLHVNRPYYVTLKSLLENCKTIEQNTIFYIFFRGEESYVSL